MSHEATNWAFQQRGIKPGPKIVLFHLANCHNPSYGGAFPSQEYLAEKCEIPRSTLNVYLNELQESGLIAREQRRKEGSKRQEATRYYFPFEAQFSQFSSPKPSPESGHGFDEAESRNQQKPSPENGESRVQNLDSNLVREPVIESVSERERERESAEEENPKVVEKAFKRWYATWPTFVTDSEPQARRAWSALSAEERNQAAELSAAYVEAAKASGRKFVCAAAVYLTEKRWEKLEVLGGGSLSAVKKMQAVNVFSRAWTAKRLATLLQPPSSRMPVPSAWQRSVIAAGGIEADKIKRDRLKLYGWPAVGDLDKRGCSVDCDLLAISEGFERVEPQTDVWAAWQALHERNGWPWLPPAGVHGHFFFPAIDTGFDDLNIAVADALARFAAQLSEANNDAA
jgi:hypothetical protein